MATPTVSNEYIWRWQCDPTFGVDGSVVGTPLQVFYRKDLDLGDGSPKTTIPSDKGLTVDLVANATKTVTVGQATYTYGELVEGLIAVMAQERAAQS